jgi:hypothetical protein
VDVGRDWRLEIFKAIDVALAGCPRLEIMSVPEIFLHYYEFTDDADDANADQPSRSATINDARGPMPRYFRTAGRTRARRGVSLAASYQR